MEGGGCAANVFLRSPSGRSIRELAEGPLPRDLTPWLPAPSAQREVTRFFSELGFQAHADALGLTVSIEGSRALFTRVFGADAGRGEALAPPGPIRDLIEEILLLPRPNLH